MRKGFTLIELLIVIGILAVLATITVLALNPAQLFAQGRDSQRIADLSTTYKALNVYMGTVRVPNLELGAGFTCGTNYTASVDGTTSPFTSSTTDVPALSEVFAIDGTGWVPVNLTLTAGASPLSTLPRDPINTTDYFYAYACDNTNKTVELNAIMESNRYANSGQDDVESTDGGDDNDVYEVGSDPDLNL